MTTLPLLRIAAAKLFATLVLVVPPTLFVSGGTWISGQLAIDRCLDRGGRWDHHMGVCDTGLLPRSEAGAIQ